MTSSKMKFLTVLFFGLLCFPGIPLQVSSAENQNLFQKSFADPVASDSTTVDYLIITSEKFQSNLEQLALWKLQRGLNVALITVEEIYTTYPGRDQPEQIKLCIEDYYTHNQTEWVLLGGNHDQVPVRYAGIYDIPVDYGDYVACDTYYGDLFNNWDSNNDSIWGTRDDDLDMDPEVYVGRLTAATTVEMSKLVANIIMYERSPPVGDWMTNNLWAGAMLFFDSDFNGSDTSNYDEIDANRFNHFLADRNPEHYTNTFLGEASGLAPSSFPYNRSLTWQNLQDEINQGAGFGSITGHGWPQGMVRTVFETDYDKDGLFDYDGDPYTENGDAIDVQESPSPLLISVDIPLDPGEKLGFYYLGGCSVGSFDHTETSLQEHFLHNAAIGAIGGSEVVWGEDFWYERDHGGWYSEGLQARFWEQLLIFNQPGKALALAKNDMVNDRIDLDEPAIYPEWEEKIFKQFNLLGDPEISLWVDIPKVLEASIDNVTSTTETNVTVYDGEDLPVSDVIISVTNNTSFELIWRGLTNASGSVAIPLSPEVVSSYSITAAKSGYIPWISFGDEIIVETETETTTDTSSETDPIDPNPGFLDNIPGYTLSTFFFAALAMTMIVLRKKTKFA